MDKLGGKIIELLNAVYALSEKDRQRLDWAILNLTEEDKKKILVAVYQRYQAFEKNMGNLTRGMQKVSNDITDFQEHIDADKILLEI